MQDRQLLVDAVEKKTDPIYLQSRSEIVDFYRDTYAGQKTDSKGRTTYEWKAKLAEALSGTSDRKSRAYKSASRQFQMDKRTGQERYLGKQTGASKERYQAVGKTLDPVGRKLKNGQITITMNGTVAGRKGAARQRSVTVTLKGPSAQAFVDNPTYDPLWDEYGVPEMGEDGAYEMQVYSVG